jgi:membrane fusion protein (multidrug efflux system)
VKLRINAAEANLREGMSAKVSLQVENQQSVLLVPRTALVDRDRHKVVYVVVDGKAQQRDVQFGLPSNDYLPVVSGLADGDLLIVEPLSLITQGVAVAVESAD